MQLSGLSDVANLEQLQEIRVTFIFRSKPDKFVITYDKTKCSSF